MDIHNWLRIVEKAYREGDAIDLLSGEMKRIKTKLTSQKKSFLSKKLSRNIFSKIDNEYDRMAYEAGAISLLQYHFGGSPIFSESQANQIKETMDVMQAYFWNQVDNKATFGSARRIKESTGLGVSIKERYSLSSGPFVDFARTYWTFRVEVLDLIENHLTTPLAQVLIQIEASVASYFFPRMQPIKPDASEIREGQKHILMTYTSKLDVDRFLSESPVLKELEKKDGCFIATSTFGDRDCLEVRALLNWRDERLLGSPIGRIFVAIYYRVSPRISLAVYNHSWLRSLSRKIIKRIIRYLQPVT